MKRIPVDVMKTFEKIKREYRIYAELKVINNTFCVYKATSKWDKEEKKVRKITEYLGVITSEGEFKKKIPRDAIRETEREIFEFGNGYIAYNFLKDIEDILSEQIPYFKEVIAYSIIKAIDPQPLRLLNSRWEKLYISQPLRVSLSPKHISSILHEIGVSVSRWYDLFSKLTTKGDIIFYDLTGIFTYSENIKIAEKGWNSNHEYLDQIGVIMAFSSIAHLPIGIEVFPGSIPDKVTIKDFRDRFQQKDIGYVFDRGFLDYKLIEELRDDKTHYILPLKKDSKYMDFNNVDWKSPFVYRDRYIRWGRKISDLGYIYFYDDPKVRCEQELALLKKVKRHKITMKEFEIKRKKAGIMGIISDLDKKGYAIYDIYKGKEDVELAFDAMKNTIDADKTYLRSEESVRGYYFITFIALRVYFKILKRLREKNLTSKISVEEVLFELSKVMKIKEKNGREYFARIPWRSRKIMELFPEIFNVFSA